MMDRRTFIHIVASGMLGVPRWSIAQPADKVWRVGYLSPGVRPPDGGPPVILRQAMRDLGYVEGRNVTYFARFAEGKRDIMDALASELVGLKPDVIVAFGFPSAAGAKRATGTVPIVIAGAGDPVGTGLIATLARPGANLTGISDQSTELSAKRLELLTQIAPNTARVAVIWNAGDQAMTLRTREIERAAGVLRVTIQALGVREPEDFDQAFAAIMRERPDALLLVTDALTNINRKKVLDFAAEQRIPAIYERSFYVRDGGLISYGPLVDDTFRRVAVYVDRILKGAKPADLPVEQPTRYELVINLRAGKALGLAIPQSMLMRADEVIQ